MKQGVLRLVPVVVTVVLLVLLWRQLQPGALWESVLGATPKWVATGLCLFAAVNVVRALRFGVLLPRPEVEATGVAGGDRDVTRRLTLATLLPLSFAVTLLGNTLPMRGSDLSFVVLSRTHVGVSAADATAALAAVRLLDLVAVTCWFVPVTLLMLPNLPATIDVPVTDTPTAAWLVLALVAFLVAAGVIVALAVLGERGASRLAGLAARFGFGDGPLGKRVLSYTRRTAEALSGLRDARVLAAALALSLLSWLCTFGWLYAFATAIGGIKGFGMFVVGATFAVLSKAIPAPTLGGHGVSETGWAIGMTLVAWPHDVAIATSLGVSLLNFGAVVLFGVPSLILLERARRQARSGVAVGA